MPNWIMGYGVIRSDTKDNIRGFILRFASNNRERILQELGMSPNEPYFPRTSVEIYKVEDLIELIESSEEITEKDGTKSFRLEFSAGFGYSAKSSLLLDEKFYFCHGDGTRVEGLITLEEACLKYNAYVEIFTRDDGFEERVLVDSKGSRITYESRNIVVVEDDDEHETYIGGFTDEWDFPWVL